MVLSSAATMDSAHLHGSGEAAAPIPSAPREPASTTSSPWVLKGPSDGRGDTDVRFSCRICLEAVNDEPVVTQCGHLYCWPCLYTWLEPGMLPHERLVPRMGAGGDATRRVCPVCKASCAVASIVPIYVRDRGSSSPSPVTDDLLMLTASSEDLETLQQQQHNEEQNETNNVSDEDIDVLSVSEMAETEATNTNIEHNMNTNSAATYTEALNMPHMTGLRRRRGSGPDAPQDRININESLSTSLEEPSGNSSSQTRSVPARPLAPATASPVPQQSAATHATPHQATSNWVTTSGRVGTGLALALQQALQTTPPPPANHSAQRNPGIPPLQQLSDQRTAAAAANEMPHHAADNDPHATEFLSRILLMLGSFVVLCLLLF